jgi:ABC-type transport system involved in Fe-S cluster assembly fused permease/ATPase subunit
MAFFKPDIRQVRWVENNLPELANLGQREVERIIDRAERGVHTLRVILMVLAFSLTNRTLEILSTKLEFIAVPGWSNRIVGVLVFLVFYLLTIPVGDAVIRWRIKSLVSVT